MQIKIKIKKCFRVSTSAMIITNEQISTAVDKTPDVVRASLKDIEAFLKDSHKQILFSVHEGMNTVSERLRLDFEGITRLYLYQFGY